MRRRGMKGFLFPISLLIVVAVVLVVGSMGQQYCGTGYLNFYRSKIRQCLPAENCYPDLCAMDYCESGPCYGWITFCLRADLCQSGQFQGCWNNPCF